MNKIRSMIALLVMAISTTLLSGCMKTDSQGLELKVANWEEYIDESIIDQFEKWYENTYGVKVIVKYSTFGTNEDLYNQMSIGDDFDLVCPSEYMIMKLMSENRLVPFSEQFFDKNREENYYIRCVSPYIESRLRGFSMNQKSIAQYAAGYMWGTLGFVYNPREILPGEAAHWNLLTNKKYKKRITTKDSIRDSYFAAMGMLTAKKVSSREFMSRPDYENCLAKALNDTSDVSVDQVKNILTKVKENVYSFETDSGKSDLVSGKVVANLQWSGDAVYSMSEAEEDGVALKYAVPEESTNLWFDGWCMMKKGIRKDKRKQQVAEAFVNFLSRPENAVRNMDYIGYTSVISGDEDDTVYDYIKDCYGVKNGDATYDLGYFFGDRNHCFTTSKEQTDGQLFAQYPTEDVIKRSVVMACFDKEAGEKINRMWIDIRCFHLK
ncbi:MAG: ABC transporter substrate-binding protein [Eubacterium sp.]|nr:ABC transporter substrate-binding protein [Eubacterium sp.]